MSVFKVVNDDGHGVSNNDDHNLGVSKGNGDNNGEGNGDGGGYGDSDGSRNGHANGHGDAKGNYTILIKNTFSCW